MKGGSNVTVKAQIKTNNSVNKTVEIKDTTATDQNITAFAKSYVTFLENNDELKELNKIVTTPLDIA